MSIATKQRLITTIVTRDPDDLSRRLAQCADFKRRLKKLHLSATAFSRLTGVSVDSVYTWTSKSPRCTPPHPMALRILSLIERDRNVIALLDDS